MRVRLNKAWHGGMGDETFSESRWCQCRSGTWHGKGNRCCKGTNVVLAAIVMIGAVFIRRGIDRSHHANGPVHRAHNERDAYAGGWIWHPACRQKHAQQHRGERERQSNERQRPRHEPDNMEEASSPIPGDTEPFRNNQALGIVLIYLRVICNCAGGTAHTKRATWSSARTAGEQCLINKTVRLHLVKASSA